MINTVKGQIKDLGITMCHEHIILDLRHVRKDDSSYILDEKLAIKEVNLAKKLGINTMIDVTCNDMGRDVLKLKKVSEETGINIICATGFYLKEYHTNFVKNAEIDEISNLLLKECAIGIDNTSIKAGIIGEIGCSKAMIYSSELKVLKAAGRTSKITNIPVSTHCDMGLLALEQINILQNEGTNPDKIIIGHTDLVDDSLYHQNIVKTGANIAFDTIGKRAYLSDEKRADNLVKLIEKGFLDKILVSQDVSKKTYLVSNGSYGYTKVMGDFIKLLYERGVKKEEIDIILVKNPQRILEMG